MKRGGHGRLLFLCFLAACGLGGRAACAEGGRACPDSRIEFDTATLEKIVREPQAVLADEEGFWENEAAQRYTRAWADNVGVRISYGKWRKQIAAFGEQDPAARRAGPLLRMTESIVTTEERFREEAIPLVCSYLPDGADLDIPVHFTAFVPPRSFVMGGIVINVSAPYWKGNADNILNNLAHELFHVGYSRQRPHRTEAAPRNEQLYGMLDSLQNEGTATWVGFQASAAFPAPDELDYGMLESADEVTRQLAELNGLFAKVGRISEERLGRLSWDKGVTRRGYYIVGAHMARTIESAQGREALVQTIAEGPASFVRRYNELVPEERQLRYEDAVTPAGGTGFSWDRIAAPGRFGFVLALVLALAALVIAIWVRARR